MDKTKKKEILNGLYLNLSKVDEERDAIFGVIKKIKKARSNQELDQIMNKDMKRRQLILKNINTKGI